MVEIAHLVGRRKTAFIVMMFQSKGNDPAREIKINI